MDVHSGSPPGPAAVNFSVCVSGVRGFARYKDGPTSLVASAEHELAAEARCRQIRNGQVPRSRRMCAISHASLTHVRCVDDFPCPLHRASLPSVHRSARMEGVPIAPAQWTEPHVASVISPPRPSPFRLLAQARRERARGCCPHGEGRSRRNEGPFRWCHEAPSAHQHAR